MYYEVKVKYTPTTEEGKPKTQTHVYLVWDNAIEGVHAQIADEYRGYASGDWFVASVTQKKIEKVIDAR